MSKKTAPQTNKRYTAEFKSEALKLAERLSAAEAAEKPHWRSHEVLIKRQVR